MKNLNIDTIDAVFEEWDRPETPGCVVGVMQSGQLVYGRGFGVANLDFNIPLDANTVMDIGSTSKQFTAACIALLILSGQISLDDEIHRWIPELPDYGYPIRLHHLIYHTSGLRDHSVIATLGGLTIEDYQDNHTSLDIVFKQRGLNFTPGSLYSYTNTNYLLLAEIIQQVSGKSLHHYAEEHLFQPLGMRSTRFMKDEHQVMKGRATSYKPGANGDFLRYLRNNHEIGATNLWTTLEDLARWDANFIRPDVGGTEFINLLMKPGRKADEAELSYAFGLMLNEHRGLKTVSHAGQWGGFRSELLRFPEQQLAVVVMTNLETVIPTRLAYQVADICLSDKMKLGDEVTSTAQGESVTVPNSILQSMTGIYHNPGTGETTELLVQNDRLHAKSNGRIFRLGALQVEEQSAEFEVLDVPISIKLKFARKAEGWQILQSFPWIGEKLFVPFASVEQDEAALMEYAGRYTNPDLLTDWIVYMKQRELWVVYGRAETDMLKPAGKDTFRAPNISIRFLREQGRHVSGLLFDMERVRNITLSRYLE